ncbi:MAG: translocation/assembly module TamB domain-containing protein [Bacteriovoracaceae bacterium]
MKKIFYLIGGFLALIVGLVLLTLAVLFFDPTIAINAKNIAWVLEKTHVLDSWSWKKMEIGHQWIKWNDRHLTGDIRDFCFRKNAESSKVYTCFDEISWDFDLGFDFKEKFFTKVHKPFKVHSPLTEVKLLPSPPTKEKSSPPDIYRYWNLFWSDMVPDMDVRFAAIRLTTDGKQHDFDFTLVKTGKRLTAGAMKFTLFANPKDFELRAPEKILIPEHIETLGPFYIRDLTLTGKVREEMIPLHLTGHVEDVLLKTDAILELPIAEGMTLKRKFLGSIKGEILVPAFRKTLAHKSYGIFRELPAPFNVLDGKVITTFEGKEKGKDEVRFDSLTNIDLASPHQVLNLDIAAGTDLPVSTWRPDTIELGLDFHQVRIELPRLSSKRPPPQMIPDKRFKNGPYRPPEEKKAATDVLVHLTALNRKALQIVTNLLDEPVRLNFDLLIGEGKVNKGHVSVLPLKTEIFRRPIRLRELVLTFDEPKEPVIKAEVLFPLPEYKIKLVLEGPVSSPRYAFTSDPPLQQNDIYAVLLFGRPLSDLDPDSRTAAQKTNQILANGILSLSVLYFLAGSPVEYVGFDPDSKSAVAQFGLTKKTSLRVGGGEEGMNSGGLRHSLGKGWYIDTGVQRHPSSSTNQNKSYGVLLERVISY